MRASLVVVCTLCGAAFLGGGGLGAQAIERSDVAVPGTIRVTFDPRIMTWNSEFTDRGRLGLGRGLTGDSVGGSYIPSLARLQQDTRFVTRIAGFVASLGRGQLDVRQERRTYPIAADVGVTSRLSLSLMVPIVRVATRTALTLSPTGSNLGLNPRITDPAGALGKYQTFFALFNTALDTLNQRITRGGYGCPASLQCAAQDSLVQWRKIRDALQRFVNVAFLPNDTSAAGDSIRATLVAIQGHMQQLYQDSAFTGATLLLPQDTIGAAMTLALQADAPGFGYRGTPFRNSFRYNLGDVELGAKYRFATGRRYAASAGLVLRLPTGARDSADDFLRQSIGDHLWGVEGRVIQEATLGPLWLNVALRAGTARAGTRIRRVAPWDAVLVPFGATATLGWARGDYLGLDVAPLLRLAPQLAAGVTAGYWTKARDHYWYRSAQDSTAVATALDGATPASVLDGGTSQRSLRFGFAVTYVGPTLEGGFSIEQTVTGAGVVPAATVYRIVLRTARRLF
ncbi:MAG TPA: hypothetical protein VH116_00470 [Gemmatimonadales bacterium]|nr:hypothetical protein [Gemmatimonadales bacterium]